MLEPERIIAHHAAARSAWLRAAALRAIGGAVALAALLIGMAAAASTEGEVLLAGLAGLVAGALAVAMCEYAAIAARSAGQATPPAANEAGEEELVVHRRRGPADDLVASPQGGLADYHGTAPLQGAATSAAVFALGGALPLAAASAFHLGAMPLGIGMVSLAGVAMLSAVSGRAGEGSSAGYVARATAWAAAGLAGAFMVGRIVGTALL